jgi:hypothetical protein
MSVGDRARPNAGRLSPIMKNEIRQDSRPISFMNIALQALADPSTEGAKGETGHQSGAKYQAVHVGAFPAKGQRLPLVRREGRVSAEEAAAESNPKIRLNAKYATAVVT